MNSDLKHSERPIRVLVVEDSPVQREFLVYLFASDQGIRVIGTAANGEEALAAVQMHKPDVVTMDLHMPKMDGYAATRAIMENVPTPIVIVSGSSSGEEMATTMNALEAGALAMVKRPPGLGHPDHTATTRELIQTVKLMAEVKVVRRWVRQKASSSPAIGKPLALAAPRSTRLVAIGASTGGPLVLQQIFSKLPKNLPVPIVVVQHIAAGFTDGFVEWLAETTGFPARIATDGTLMQAGSAYIAPNGYQMTVDGRGCIQLKNDEPEYGHCPAVSHMFRSVAAAYGANAMGVLLTGMGRDGAAELGLMRAAGAMTIAQDKESSVVHGMPGEAIALGAAADVLSPDRIAALIASLAKPPQGA